MVFKATRSSSSGTKEVYRNMDAASSVAAVKESDNKWYAKGFGPGGDFYFLATAGYADEATCQAAIKTALSIT